MILQQKNLDSTLLTLSTRQEEREAQLQKIQAVLDDNLLQKMPIPDKLPEKLSVFKQKKQLDDFIRNPDQPCYEKAYLELVSLNYNKKIIIYYFNQDFDLHSIIINNKFSSQIELISIYGNFEPLISKEKQENNLEISSTPPEMSKMSAKGKPMHKKSMSESKLKFDIDNNNVYDLFSYNYKTEEVLNNILTEDQTKIANNNQDSFNSISQKSTGASVNYQNQLNNHISGNNPNQTSINNNNNTPNLIKQTNSQDTQKNSHLPSTQQDNDDDGDQLINEINNRIEISSPIEQSPEFNNITNSGSRSQQQLQQSQPKEVKNSFLLNTQIISPQPQIMLSVSPQPQPSSNVIQFINENRSSFTPPKSNSNNRTNLATMNDSPPNMPINIARSSYTPPPQQIQQQQQPQQQAFPSIMQPQSQQQQQQYLNIQSQQNQLLNAQQYRCFPDLLANQQQAKNRPIILPDSLERYSGTLKFFDENRNYGFIVMDMDMSDIFVHYDDIAKANINKDYLKLAKHGTRIRFSFSCMNYIGKYNKSRKAVDLQLLQDNNDYIFLKNQ